MLLLLISTLLSLGLVELIKYVSSKDNLGIQFSFSGPNFYIGISLTLLALMLNGWANYTLLVIGKIGLKNREPFKTPSNLVIKGPFRYSRNPIYLSTIVLIFGLFVLFSYLLAFISSFLLFLVFHLWFIPWEEKKLEDKFDNEYREFKRSVRRWI